MWEHHMSPPPLHHHVSSPLCIFSSFAISLCCNQHHLLYSWWRSTRGFWKGKKELSLLLSNPPWQCLVSCWSFPPQIVLKLAGSGLRDPLLDHGWFWMYSWIFVLRCILVFPSTEAQLMVSLSHTIFSRSALACFYQCSISLPITAVPPGIHPLWNHL